MRRWLPTLEVLAYRSMARLAARALGQLAPVRGVYTRRSVACGEIVFGKSDIDLSILIDSFPDVHTEATFLRELATRYTALKRVIPCLGECEVSTRVELEHWHRSPAYAWYWYRDRAWLTLYGEPVDRPCLLLAEGKERDCVLWWFFWAWERLPGFYRAANVRTCYNLFVDMLNAYYLYLGVIRVPKRRAEVCEQWLATVPPSRERDHIRRGLQRGFRGDYHALKQWIYVESLKLCDALYSHVLQKLEGKAGDTEVTGQVPFNFSQRRYVLVDPLNQHQVEQAVEAMQRQTEVFVTTEKALKLYLYHRNPWEYVTLKAGSQQFALSPPPAEAFFQAVRFALYKMIPRRAGFSIGKQANRSLTIGPRYAQCQLYVDDGIVATSGEDLLRQYQMRYGVWPYSKATSRDNYFLHDYPVVCQTIEELALSQNER